MPDPVLSSTMTLDGSQYLATSQKVLAVTQQVEAALLRIRTQFTQLMAVLAPTQSSLSATALALGGLSDDGVTRGVAALSAALSNVASRASDAGAALSGARSDAEGLGNAMDQNQDADKSEAESHEAEHAEHGSSGAGNFDLHQIEASASTAVVAAGQKQIAGPAAEVTEIKKLEEIETEAAAATQHLAQDMHQLAAAVTHEGAEAQKAGAQTHQLAQHESEATEKAKHLREEVRDAAVGFRGLGETAAKAGELIRDAFVAVPEVAAVVGIFAGVGEVVKKIHESMEYGDQLNALSRQTGESATSIAALRRTFEYFDVSADEVGHTLFMLQRAMGGVSEGGEPTAEAFSRIGLSIQDLKKMDAASQFAAIQKGLSTLPTQADKANVAMKIFGRSALEVQSILNASPADFAESMAAAQDYAQVMGQNADAFEDIQRKFFVMKEQVDTVFARIAGALIPVMNELLDTINKVDFKQWGVAIGNVIGVITNAFSQGKVFQVIGDGLKLAFIDAVNSATQLLYGLAGAFTSYITDFLPTGIKSAFTAVTNPDLWKGIANLCLGAFLSIEGRLNQMFLGIGVSFVSLLQKGLSDMVNAFANNSIVRTAITVLDPTGAASVLLGALKPDNRSFAQIQADNAAKMKGDYDALGKDSATGDAMVAKGAGQISSALVPYVQNMSAALARMETAFQDYYKNAPTAIDPTSAIAKINADILSLIPQQAAPDGSGSRAPGSAQMQGYNYKLPEGDRLAKVGLFLGSSAAAPGLSELRRIASATEEMNKRIGHLGMGTNVTRRSGDPAVYQ